MKRASLDGVGFQKAKEIQYNNLYVARGSLRLGVIMEGGKVFKNCIWGIWCREVDIVIAFNYYFVKGCVSGPQGVVHF